MGSTARDAFEFAAAQSGKVAVHAKGNWRKILAFGAASAVVFVAAAAGYAAFKKRDEEPGKAKDEGKSDDAYKGADEPN